MASVASQKPDFFTFKEPYLKVTKTYGNMKIEALVYNDYYGPDKHTCLFRALLPLEKKEYEFYTREVGFPATTLTVSAQAESLLRGIRESFLTDSGLRGLKLRHEVRLKNKIEALLTEASESYKKKSEQD